MLWTGDEFPEERGSCLVPFVAFFVSLLVVVAAGGLIVSVVSQ